MTPDRSGLVRQVAARARARGFDAFGIAPAGARPDLPARLDHALDQGWHAGMDWMETTRARRASPNVLWPEAKSIVMLGISYRPDTDPLDLLAHKDRGAIAAYARSRDYHDVVKGKLKEIAGVLARLGACGVKVFVDTAPVMEKPLAQAAGLGWQGKHSVLVSRSEGSWLFLGAIFCDIDLPPSAPETDRCGSCTRCLDICPTGAFPAPYRLDANRCLAYWSVEAKDQIPRALRAPMGNRVFGCDDCLAVCPWNKFAGAVREIRLADRHDLTAPPLAELVELDDAAFRARFAGTPVKRLGRDRFVRNVLIAIGNSGDQSHVPAVLERLADGSALVRGAAVWALRRLVGDAGAPRLRPGLVAAETDPDVRAEWHGAAVPPLGRAA